MRIDRSTQILALLRTELTRLRKAEKASTRKAAGPDRPDTLTPSQRLPDLLKEAEFSPSQQRRLLIQALLTDGIDQLSANSLQTEAVVDEIQAILERHEAGRELLDAAMDAAGFGTDPGEK